MAGAALPGPPGFTSRRGTPVMHGSATRLLQRGLVRTAAFVAAFCAVPGIAALVD